MPKYTPTASEKVLIQYVNALYADWYEGEVFITPNISFCVRKIIERARRCYYGVFETPFDEVDGDEKYWPPLTEHIVETIVKNTDIDTRNFQLFNNSNPDLHGFARVLRLIVLDKMKRMRFGAKLNDIIRQASMGGGTPIKAMDVWDEKRKRWVRDMIVIDALNAVANPACDSIDDTPVIERAVMTPLVFNTYGKWKNKSSAKAQPGLNASDLSEYGRNNKNSAKAYEVFEFWGEAPIFCLTGEAADKDSDKTAYIHAVMTGLSFGGSSGKVVVHLVEESQYKDQLTKKPYKEIRFRKVPNRRHGRGAAEALFGAQMYLNGIINMRKTNGKLLQNGLFKGRVGSGVTQDVVSQIVGGGVIPVDKMDDLEQLTVTDYRASSYADEDRIFAWAQRQTFAVEQGKIPSSQPATNSIIQDRNSGKAFDLVQEDFAIPLAEFFEEFIIPNLANEYDAEEILRVTGDPTALDEIDQVYVNHLVNMAVQEYIAKEQSIPPTYVVEEERRAAINKLKRLGPNRHIKIWKEVFQGPVSVEMVVTNERIDPALIVQNLKEIMAVNAANPNSMWSNDKIISRALDLMGLDTHDFDKTVPERQTAVDMLLTSPRNRRAAGGLTAPNVSKAELAPANPTAGMGAPAQLAAGAMVPGGKPMM